MPIDLHNFARSVGLRHGLGIDRDETLLANYAKPGKRYEGLRFSDTAANYRADKKELK